MKKTGLFFAIALLAFGTAQASEPDYIFTHISPGCREKAVMSEIAQLMESGDTEATLAEVRTRMNRGECTGFREGMRVYVTDTALLKGLAKVRAKGTPEAFWVPMDAIRSLK